MNLEIIEAFTLVQCTGVYDTTKLTTFVSIWGRLLLRCIASILAALIGVIRWVTVRIVDEALFLEEISTTRFSSLVSDLMHAILLNAMVLLERIVLDVDLSPTVRETIEPRLHFLLDHTDKAQ